MKILGLDPGSLKTGYGLIETTNIGRGFKLLDSGVIVYPAKVDYLDRLGMVKNAMEELLTKCSPDEVAMESLIYVKSPTVLIKLAQFRGAMLSVILQTHRHRFFEYSPNLVKSSSTGQGHISKEAMQKTLSNMVGPIDYTSFDESDAIAVALCHLLHQGQKISGKKRGKGMAQSLGY